MTAPTDATRVDPMPIEDVPKLPGIVPVWPTASAALGGSDAGLGRVSTYAKAKNGTYPVPVLAQGRRLVVRRADILAYLGLNSDGARWSDPTPSVENAPVHTSSH